ncbi:MAG TPA: hypothetical protein EYH31_13720 [Anaerolineae bacterium]|nr:hypothetical protein [Anaerolineae bacterium]
MRLSLIGLVLVGLALRLIQLNFQPLWWDEGYTVWFTTHPIPQMVALTARDIHPPLYYALLTGWISLLGLTPGVLRLFSVFVGTLTIPVTYIVGRALSNRRVALLAALLIAINPMHVYYSQEVRMYGLVALWAMLALWLGQERSSETDGVLTQGRERWRWIAYTAVVLAGLYTQYYFAFLPLAQLVYALAVHRSPPFRRRLLTSQAVAALLYLPWIGYAVPKLMHYVAYKVTKEADVPLDPLTYLARHLAAFVTGHLEGTLTRWWLSGLLPLVIVVVALLVVSRFRPGSALRRSVTFYLLICLFVPLVLGYALNVRFPFTPVRGERLLLFAAPAFWLLLALGLAMLWQKAKAAAWGSLALIIVLNTVSLTGFYRVPRYPEDDYRPIVAMVMQEGRPNDTVFCVFPWQVGYFRAYGRADGPQPELSPSERWGDDVANALESALARGHLWFPAHQSLGAILETQAEHLLRERAYPFYHAWHGSSTRLTGWAALTDEQSTTSVPIHFAEELRLESASVTTAVPAAANDVVGVELRWAAPGRIEAPLRVTLRLADGAGRTWSQREHEPLGLKPVTTATGWAAKDRLGILVPTGTPPGTYELRLGVQRVANDRALDVLDEAGRPHGTEAILVTLRVNAPTEPPSPATLPIQHPADVNLGEQVRFLGHSAGEGPFAPGDELKVSLFWQALTDVQQDYRAFLQLLDRQGKLVAAWEGPPVGWYPTSQWTTGTLIRSQHTLLLPATLKDGRYRFTAGLFDPTTGRRLRWHRHFRSGDYIELGRVPIKGRAHDFTPPRPTHPLAAQFGGSARLVGYDLEPTQVAPGGQLQLTLYWQVTGSFDRRYTVFVHLLDPKGSFRGLADAEPGEGAFPTTGWLPGEYLRDKHIVPVAEDAPPGSYRIEIGLYDPVSNARLPLVDEAGTIVGDHLVLDTPVVVVKR